MKKLLQIVFALLITASVAGQIKSPVKWEFSAVKINATTYELHLTATIDNGWHVYSQTTPKGGPLPAKVSFTKNPLLVLKGTAKEVGQLDEHFEPLFEVKVKQYSTKVDFVQTLQVKANVKTTAAGTVKFMTCNDKECLPPITLKFSLSIN
jgi:Disulphide bond corrector protein DsbC